MTESKVSPELNIAIDLSVEEREKSLDLNVGYSEEFEEWELIIRYTGSLSQVRDELGISIEELLGGYAIVRIPQYLIGRLSDYPQINYIEKPKSLILDQMVGITASCINSVRLPDYSLKGKGVLVACLDSGIVNGNDPYLYGEKVRASLIRGARKLPFQERQPSPLVGWGALCVADSLPRG